MPVAVAQNASLESNGSINAELLHFTPVAPSSEPLSYADLATVDMATFNDGPQAQSAIAETLRKAMHEHGFFTLINHGITPQEIERQLDIAHVG